MDVQAGGDFHSHVQSGRFGDSMRIDVDQKRETRRYLNIINEVTFSHKLNGLLLGSQVPSGRRASRPSSPPAVSAALRATTALSGAGERGP